MNIMMRMRMKIMKNNNIDSDDINDNNENLDDDQ